MANEPKNRHSKPRREPVTIDLEPSQVNRLEDEAAAADPSIDAGAREGESAAAEPDAELPVTGDAPGADPDGPSGPGDRSSEDRPPRRQASWASAVAGGIIGAAVAVGGAAALQWNGLLPAPEEGVAGLRQEIEALRANPPAFGKDVQAAIADARRAADSASDQARAAASTATQARDQLASMEKTVDAVRNTSAQSNSADVKALQDGLAGLAQKVAGLARNPPPAPAMEKSVAQLSNDVQALSAKVSGLSSAAEKTAASAAQNSKAVSDDSSAVASLKSDMADMRQKVLQNAGQPRIARAIAASALKAAVDRGGPFTTELQTYAAVAPGSPKLASLKPLAAAGIPTLGELQARFDAVADRIIESTRPANRSSGLLGSLIDSARSLVSVRPVGMVAGTTPSAIVARMETDLRSDDLDRALAEWNTLPDAARVVSKDFADSLRARQQANRMVAAALADALTPGKGRSDVPANGGAGGNVPASPDAAFPGNNAGTAK